MAKRYPQNIISDEEAKFIIAGIGQIPSSAGAAFLQNFVNSRDVGYCSKNGISQYFDGSGGESTFYLNIGGTQVEVYIQAGGLSGSGTALVNTNIQDTRDIQRTSGVYTVFDYNAYNPNLPEGGIGVPTLGVRVPAKYRALMESYLRGEPAPTGNIDVGVGLPENGVTGNIAGH